MAGNNTLSHSAVKRDSPRPPTPYRLILISRTPEKIQSSEKRASRMVPGLGFIGRRLGKRGKQSKEAPESYDRDPSVPGVKQSLSKAPAGVYDSVHSLNYMDTAAVSASKPSPPPSPTSILPEVNFLDLNGSDSKSSEPSVSTPDDEPTLTADDPEWQWHEPATEVDPKDAATPDR